VGDARRRPRLLGPLPAFRNSSHQLASSPSAVAQSVALVIIKFTAPGRSGIVGADCRRIVASYRAESITGSGLPSGCFYRAGRSGQSRYLLCRKGFLTASPPGQLAIGKTSPPVTP
jgi:hypothetical protein